MSYNDKNQPHGYWKVSWGRDNRLLNEGYFINGKKVGMWLWFDTGELYNKFYFI